MRKNCSNRNWGPDPWRFSRSPEEAPKWRQPLKVDLAIGEPKESPECFTVTPRQKLNRFRNSISATRLSLKGWYKRYKGLVLT